MNFRLRCDRLDSVTRLDTIFEDIYIETKYRIGQERQDIVVQNGLIPFGAFPRKTAGIIRRIGVAVEDQSLSIGNMGLLSFSSCRSCYYCASANMEPALISLNLLELDSPIAATRHT